MAQRSMLASSPVVAIAGFLMPGAGYVLLGDVARGLTVGITILALFMGGVLIAGIRVIDVPGYDNLGNQRRYLRTREGAIARVDPENRRAYEAGEWAMKVRPLNEIIEKPWFVAQVLVGPVAIVGANWSLVASQPQTPGSKVPAVPASHARIADIGALYTAVAGMLNLLAVIDATSRAGRREE